VIGAIIVKGKVARAFEALNQRDVDAFLKDWRADASKVFPGTVSGSGEVSGTDAIRDWYARFFAQFPELTFTVRSIGVDRIWDVTGNNVATAVWDIEVTNRAGERHRNTGVTVIAVTGGKVARVVDYIFDTGEAFRRAWGTDAVADEVG
jgi:ketosteroid isomerase-like protein